MLMDDILDSFVPEDQNVKFDGNAKHHDFM